jgi:hypothetical protein
MAPQNKLLKDLLPSAFLSHGPCIPNTGPPKCFCQLGLPAATAFLSRLTAICTVSADALISLGSQPVSAFLSHGGFCTAGLFDSQDALYATALHRWRKNPQSIPDCVSSRRAPESFCASSDIPVPCSISVFFQPADPAQKIARTRHTSFLETFQVGS